jgi:hypothetical protein
MNKGLSVVLVVLLLLPLMAGALAEAIDYSEYIFCEDIPHWTPDPYHNQYQAATPTPVAFATGSPLSVDGNATTRDLLFDKHTNKQFVTLETRKGNPFFLVIDYDKPTDTAGEQFDTFFLNKVDEADLMSLLADDEKEGLTQSCTCKDKCQPGAVNTACPVCKKDMSECKGIAPTPTPKPVTTPEPTPVPEPVSKGSGMGGIILLLVLAVAGGGGLFYFKRMKGAGKSKQAGIPEYDDDYEEEPYADDEDELDEEEPS